MPRLSMWMIRAALLHLGAGFTFGALMLWEKGLHTNPMLWRLLPLHIEMLLLGWTFQMAMGVAYWVLPRFAGGQRRNHVPAWAAFALINSGVLAVSAGAWFATDWLILVGRTIELLAAVAFALHSWSRVKPLGA